MLQNSQVRLKLTLYEAEVSPSHAMLLTRRGASEQFCRVSAVINPQKQEWRTITGITTHDQTKKNFIAPEEGPQSLEQLAFSSQRHCC